MCLEKNIATFIRDKGINLSVISRETGIPYMSLYDSFFNTKKNRPIKGQELVSVCTFLGVNPMDFAKDPVKEGGEKS